MLITRVERQQNLPEKRRSANQRKLFNIPVDTFAAKTSDRNNKGMNSLQKSKIKMAHLNIRSLKNRNHLIQLRNFAEEENYGIIAISELWLNSTVANAEVEIAGYKLSRLERLNKTGGVCVYTRSSLKTKVLRDLTGISDSGFHQLWLQIQHDKLKSFLLCVTYRPRDCPTSCFVDDFMDKYSQALTHGKEIFIAGDLNCNVMKHSPEANALNDLCSNLNLTQLITSLTRETSESSTLIDVIMTSNPGLVVESGTVETRISDHHLVYSTLNLKLPKPTPTYAKTRCYKHRNFLENLAQVPWSENVLIDNASEKVNHFNHYFLEVLNQHTPIKTVKIKHHPCPFVDQEMKEHMKNRNQLLKISKQTRSSEDWEIYRLSGESVKAQLRDSEREHAKTELNCKKTSSMWKVIRNCIPCKEISQPVYSRDLKDVAEEFNNFFTSVGTRVSEESTSLIGKHNLPTPPIPTPGQEIPESKMLLILKLKLNKIC